MSARFIAWFIALCVAAFAAFVYGQITTAFDTPSVWRVGLFSLLGIAGLLSVFSFPTFRSRRALLLAIWVPAILLRILLLPTAVSDDVSRYLFEGKLVRLGINPYAQTADAASIAQHRDTQWEMMNHKDKPTAYPPLSQFVFATTGAISYQPLVYKLVFVLADLLTLAAVLKLLRRRGLSWAFSGFYALNPIVLIAFAGEAHFDSMMIAALMWALCAYEAGRTRIAVILASIATGIKWIALPLIPFFCGKRLLTNSLIASAVLVLPTLYFFDAIDALFHGLFAFGGTRNFNGLLYEILLYSVGLPRTICNGIVLVVFASVIAWRWLCRNQDPLDTHARWILGALLVVSPTIHFWYLAWIIPWICLRPSLPWLTLSVTASSYFFVWVNDAEGSGWTLSLWQQCFFWGPFILASMYTIWITRGRALRPIMRVPTRSKEPSFAIVMPTLNVAKTLPDALASIQQQTVSVDEVIAVDAGSTDATVQLLEASPLPIKVLSSERGRGVQIALGIEAAQADWIVVLHADAVLEANAIESIHRAIAKDNTLIGGALGQRFKSGSFALLLIECLNDLRALFSFTAFGDQVQFFHRKTALRYELMPKQPLMEDVESSWRIRENGNFVFVNEPCTVSYEKWIRGKRIKRIFLVMRLISKYRWARMRGKHHAEDLSRKLYAEYYP